MSTCAERTPGSDASAPSIECLQWSQWIPGTTMVAVVMASSSTRSALEQPVDRGGGLGDDRVALGIVAGGVADAVAQVVVQQRDRHLAQGRVDRGDLRQHVDAV